MLKNVKEILNKNFFKIFLSTYSILILLSFFYNFFEYDESWIFEIIINYKKGITSTYSTPLAFGQSIYFELLSLISLSEDAQIFFANRIFSLLAITGNIFLIFKIVKKDYKQYSDQILLVIFFLYSFWFCFHEGGMSSRPDSLFSFLLLFLIYSFFEYNNKKYLFYISTILNIFFIFYHPVGFYVLFINFCFLYYVLPKKKFLIFNSVIFLLIINLIIFTNYFQIFFESYNSFIERFAGKEINGVEDIFIIMYDNILRDLLFKGRAKHMLGYSKYSFMYFCILYLISIYAIFFFKKENKNFKTFIFIFVTLNIFYLILPNKWRHHLGVIVPVLIIIFYYMQMIFINEKLFLKVKNNLKFINIILMIIFLIKINYHVTNNLFLKNYLNKFINTNNINYYKKLNVEQKQIDSHRNKLTNFTFTANPVFKYVFDKSKYVSNYTTYDTDFFIMSKKKYCSINKKKETISYEFYESFVLYNHKYAICIKKDLF